MKKRLILVLTAMVLGAACLVWAQSAKRTVFGVGGTATATNLNTAIIPVGDGYPVVTHYYVRSDNAAGGFTWHGPSTSAPKLAVVTGFVGGAGTTNLILSTTNGIDAADIVVIRHINSYDAQKEIYEYRTVTSMTATSMVITALGTAAVAGDIVYECNSNLATNTIGDTTKEATSVGGLFVGTAGWPLVMRVHGVGSNTVEIGDVAGYYKRVEY